jgi:ATP-binding cassette, subfamily B, bacterial
MSDVNAAIKETISGISIAKNFRQEESIFKSFDESNQQSYQVNVQRGLVLSLVFPTLNALGGIFVAILIYVGGLSAAQGIVTVGAWYLFIMSLDQFFFPVLNLSAFWAQIQAGLSAAERAFALIDADPNVVQTDTRDVPPLKGKIHFDNLHFQYVDNEPILAGFHLLVQPGETLALVGHTGAGKSSIAKLVARFYEYQQGRLLIDDHDIRTFDLAQYRRQLGIVSQVPFLFSGTVADNIRYAAPDVAEEDILTMARKIGEGEWLETLPNGIRTEVGERGGRLSMGQRQLDPFTEWQIQQALNLILKHSTSILIAHRLSTVKAADRIVVMENGRIIEEGNHNGLLEQGGHYATLYNTYFRHQSLAYVEKARELVGDD